MTSIQGILPNTPQKWALFDLDWTITRPTTTATRPTLAGGPFSLYADDWTVIPGRLERIQDFIRDGYRIGIITNQKWKGSQLQKALTRLQNVYNFLSKYIPDLVILASTDETTRANPTDPSSLYRKPGRGWAYHLRFLPGSFYVGDAVQDPSRPERSWGYSDSDREFATAIGLPFYSPEEFFPQLTIPPELFAVPKVVLITVGPPGSGKSTFAKAHPDFVHIESDAYKSNWQSMQRALRQALSSGTTRVIIDATNPTRERRREIAQIAAEYGVPTGIVLFQNSGKWAHRDQRERPKMAYNMYWSRYEEPNQQLEGATIYYQT